MGFRRHNWPATPRTILCAFHAIRDPGMLLWPDPGPECDDLAPLPEQLERLPEILECAALKAELRARVDGPPLWTQHSPHESPPFRSKPINETLFVVVGSDDAITIGEMADLGNGLFSPATVELPPVIEVFPPTGAPGGSADNPQIFLELLPDVQERIHLSAVEITPSSVDAVQFLKFTVSIGGETYMDSVSLDDLRDISIDAPPGRPIEFSVSNREPVAAFLLFFKLKGWRYPCDGRGNFLTNALLRTDGDWIPPQPPCVPNERTLRQGGFCP